MSDGDVNAERPRQEPAIRVSNEAREVVEQIVSEIGWKKSEVVSACVMYVHDVLEGRGESRFLDLIRKVRGPAPDKQKLSPELEDLISSTVSETLKKVLENRDDLQLNEDSTPYKAKKRRKAQ